MDLCSCAWTYSRLVKMKRKQMQGTSLFLVGIELCSMDCNVIEVIGIWISNSRVLNKERKKNKLSKGLFTLLPFSTLLNFSKVVKKVAIFSLLPNFGNYIRNHIKVLASLLKFWQLYQNLAMPKFGKFLFGIKVNRPQVHPTIFSFSFLNYHFYFF